MLEKPELFNTPMLRYLNIKRTFLEKFLDKGVWEGEFGSRELVIALDGVLDYFQKTSDLAEEFPQVLDSVANENKNLVLQHVLPLPLKLYEQLLLDVVQDEREEGYQLNMQKPDRILSKIVNFFARWKRGCLSAFETHVWSEVNNLNN